MDFPRSPASPGQFLVKDVVLLGAAIWTLADSLRHVADRKGSAPPHFAQFDDVKATKSRKTKEAIASQQLDAAKPLLVLLHGTTGFSEDWSGVVGSLLENRVVIRPDYMNSKLTAGSAYTSTMAEAASRVLSAAAATSGSPFDLVGYSLGAGVAAFIAAEHPEVVRSLVLISGFAYGGDVWMKLQFNLWLDLLRTDRIALTRLLLLTGPSRDFVSNMDEDTMAAAIQAFAASSDWESIQHAIRLDLNVDLRDTPRSPRRLCSLRRSMTESFLSFTHNS